MTDQTGEPEVTIDPSRIPTKELLKRQRKAEYEAKKARLRAEKAEEKARAAASQATQRKTRDAELWSMIKKGE